MGAEGLQDEPVFNPLDPELAIDPFPILRRLRDVDPVFFAEGLDAYVVTGHDAAWKVLSRRDGDLRWEQFQRVRHGDGVVEQPYFKLLGEDVLMKAGQEHKRVRRTFQRNLLPGTVEPMRDDIAVAANELVDRFVADGRVELLRGFASPLPLVAISRLLEVPLDDEDQMWEWMQGFKLAIQMLPLDEVQLAKANDSISALDAHFKVLIDERRKNPGDDLMSKMIADADEGLLSEEELVTNVWGLYVGGHDTTALSICNSIVTLLEHPDQVEALKADPSKIANAVDELLRHIGTVHGTHRLLPVELNLDGHTIPPDTPIMVYLSAANHDESWCPHAEQLDIEREVPADHLAFGTGPHKCPGRHMARTLLQIALEVLITRLPNLRVEELEWDDKALLFRGPERLVLTWDTEA
jgi:pimeloyl-[acyl-carrier protein] synthase